MGVGATIGATIGVYFGNKEVGAGIGLYVENVVNADTKTTHLSWGEASLLASDLTDKVKMEVLNKYGDITRDIGLVYAQNLLAGINEKINSGTTWKRATFEVKRDLEKFINNPNQNIMYGYVSVPVWLASVWVFQNYDKNRQQDLDDNLDFWIFAKLNEVIIKMGLTPLKNIRSSTQSISPSSTNNLFDSIWNILFPKKDYSQFQQGQTQPQQSGFDIKTLIPIAVIGIGIWYLTKK